MININKKESFDAQTWLPYILGDHILLFMGLSIEYLSLLPFFAEAFILDFNLVMLSVPQRIVVFTVEMQRHWLACVILVLCLLTIDMAVFLHLSKTRSIRAGLYWSTAVKAVIGLLLILAIVLAISSLKRN